VTYGLPVKNQLFTLHATAAALSPPLIFREGFFLTVLPVVITIGNTV